MCTKEKKPHLWCENIVLHYDVNLAGPFDLFSCSAIRFYFTFNDIAITQIMQFLGGSVLFSVCLFDGLILVFFFFLKRKVVRNMCRKDC